MDNEAETEFNDWLPFMKQQITFVFACSAAVERLTCSMVIVEPCSAFSHTATFVSTMPHSQGITRPWLSGFLGSLTNDTLLAEMQGLAGSESLSPA